MRITASTLHKTGTSLLLMAVMIICYSNGWGQKVSTLIDRGKILLGEQVTVTIKVTGINKAQVQQDFQFPDTVNHLEILADSAVQLSDAYVHTLTLTCFDSGTWTLPAYTIRLSDQTQLSTTPLTISVLPVDVSNLEDYHDIKDVLEVPVENNWWIIAGIVLAFLVSLFAVLWLMNNRTVSAPEKITPQGLAEQYTALIQQLQYWENQQISNPAETRELFRLTVAAIRGFTDAALYTRTSHLTSGEYMLSVRTSLPQEAIRDRYFQFLRLADAVKFAKFIPPQEEVQNIFPMLRQTAETVYQPIKMQG